MSKSRAALVHKVKSWPELLDELYRDSWNRELRRHRSPFVYRGMPDAGCDLHTSLMRLARGGDITKLEGHLLRNFRKYAHFERPGDVPVWNLMALAAHHALPTRLLDWTYSPFVALHFATADTSQYHRDAVIWCVNHRETNKHLPKELRAALDNEGSNVFTAEMLHETAASLRKLETLSKEPFVLFLEPPSIDARIVNQFALFSLMSSATAALDQWLEQHPDVYRRVILPARLKWEVRDKLDQAGITERMLFPGLDGLTAWLTRYYTPHSPSDFEHDNY